MHTIKCMVCGKEVVAIKKAKRFCSDECAYRYRYVPVVKDQWRVCSYCGKDVWVRPRNLNRKNHFCNKAHALEYQKKNAFKLNCVVCGKEFSCQPYQVKMRGRKTCSMECRSKLQKIRACERHRSGIYTDHQIDRSIRYSSEMLGWRDKIFRRDDYTCQVCKKRGGYIEAHHIKPFAFFPEERTNLDNGITLCRECHNKTKVPYTKMRKKYLKECKTVSA